MGKREYNRLCKELQISSTNKEFDKNKIEALDTDKADSIITHWTRKRNPIIIDFIKEDSEHTKEDLFCLGYVHKVKLGNFETLCTSDNLVSLASKKRYKIEL
jgi:hypothetical protein